MKYFFRIIFLLFWLFSCKSSDENLCRSHIQPLKKEIIKIKADVEKLDFSNIDEKDSEKSINPLKSWSQNWLEKSQRPIESARLHSKGTELVPLLNHLSNSFVLIYGILDSTKNKVNLIKVLKEVETHNSELEALLCK